MERLKNYVGVVGHSMSEISGVALRATWAATASFSLLIVDQNKIKKLQKDRCKRDSQGADGRQGGLPTLAFTLDGRAIPAQNEWKWTKEKKNPHLTELSAWTFSAYFAFSVFTFTRLKQE